MTPRSRAVRALPYAVLAAAGGYLYHVATRIEFQQRAGTLGPDVWPKAILALLIVACLFQIVKLLLFADRGEVAGATERMMNDAARDGAGSGIAPAAEPHWRLLGGGIALTVAYVAVIQTAGFFLATVIYLAAFIAMGGYRRWGVLAAVSVGGAVLLLFFFMKVVYVSLPIGTGPFAQLTLLLMQLMGIR
jgi:putative tricarboxylic transport membrane protein